MWSPCVYTSFVLRCGRPLRFYNVAQAIHYFRVVRSVWNICVLLRSLALLGSKASFASRFEMAHGLVQSSRTGFGEHVRLFLIRRVGLGLRAKLAGTRESRDVGLLVRARATVLRRYPDGHESIQAAQGYILDIVRASFCPNWGRRLVSSSFQDVHPENLDTHTKP